MYVYTELIEESRNWLDDEEEKLEERVQSEKKKPQQESCEGVLCRVRDCVRIWRKWSINTRSRVGYCLATTIVSLYYIAAA